MKKAWLAFAFVAFSLTVHSQKQDSLSGKAATKIIHEKLKNQDAEGGLIAVDKAGNFVMEFNMPGMFRGYSNQGG